MKLPLFCRMLTRSRAPITNAYSTKLETGHRACGDSINEKWTVLDVLAEGGIGIVYRGVHELQRLPVIIKVEKRKYQDMRDETCKEHRIYQHLTDQTSSPHRIGIPVVIEFITTPLNHITIMYELGPSLEDLLSDRGGRNFNLKTTLLIGLRLLRTLEHVHTKGVVHGDIKPENVLVGKGDNANRLFLIDFGESTRYQDETGTLAKPGKNLPFYGTPSFAPIRAHRGVSQTARDDLESLGYLLVYLHHGLSWDLLKARNTTALQRNILKRKTKIRMEKLCGGVVVFMEFFDYVGNLAFGENPNHSFLRKMFRRAVGERLDQNEPFEWVV